MIMKRDEGVRHAETVDKFLGSFQVFSQMADDLENAHQLKKKAMKQKAAAARKKK